MPHPVHLSTFVLYTLCIQYTYHTVTFKVENINHEQYILVESTQTYSVSNEKELLESHSRDSHSWWEWRFIVWLLVDTVVVVLMGAGCWYT